MPVLANVEDVSILPSQPELFNGTVVKVLRWKTPYQGSNRTKEPVFMECFLREVVLRPHVSRTANDKTNLTAPSISHSLNLRTRQAYA